jgi:hypothetical protein
MRVAARVKKRVVLLVQKQKPRSSSHGGRPRKAESLIEQKSSASCSKLEQSRRLRHQLASHNSSTSTAASCDSRVSYTSLLHNTLHSSSLSHPGPPDPPRYLSSTHIAQPRPQCCVPVPPGAPCARSTPQPSRPPKRLSASSSSRNYAQLLVGPRLSPP